MLVDEDKKDVTYFNFRKAFDPVFCNILIDKLTK